MSSSNSSTTKLAAILFADIQGYTSLMQKDQPKAAKLLRRFQSELTSSVASHDGRIVNFYGDGALTVFDAPIDAVRCAMQLNSKFTSDSVVPVRLGVHSGPVVFEEDKVYGNSVNIASRIESMGVPGAVLISNRVKEDIKNQPDIAVKELGSFKFKNVEEPMEVYAIANAGFKVPKSSDLKGKFDQGNNKTTFSSNLFKAFIGVSVIVLSFFIFNLYSSSNMSERDFAVADSIDSNKSIAVLPLKNLSGQEDLEYVCVGMTDAIITRLGMIGEIDRVPSITSVLKYQSSDQSLIEIAEELNVAKILQGSFQKAGEQIRITLQLIDGKSDDQIWNHTYSGDWKPEDIFGIQAAVTENVAEEMNARITDSEINAIQKESTSSQEAYNLFLQAEHQRLKYNEQAFLIAIPHEEALRIDSTFVDAYVGLANIWSTGGLVWGAFDEKEAWTKAKRYFFKAIEIDNTNQRGIGDYWLAAFYYDWDFELCEPYFLKIIEQSYLMPGRDYVEYANKTLRSDVALIISDKMVVDRPTFPMSYFSKAETLFYLDRKEEAAQILIRSDKLYSDNQFYVREAAKYYYYLKDYDRFQSHVKILTQNFTDRAPIHLWMMAVSNLLDGNDVEVKKYLNRIEEKYKTNQSGSPAWFLAMYYFGIDDVENGFLWLERSYERHEVELTWLQKEPLLDKVRTDPRYLSIHRKMKWPKVLMD